MNLPHQIARNIREVHFGNNWTWSSLQEALQNVDWRTATLTLQEMNSIATLVFHMNFYLNVVANRITGNIPSFKHTDSFVVPNIQDEDTWQALVTKTWEDAETFASIVENMQEADLWTVINKEYGNYYRNIHGVIEHTHYHLGQIVILKKLILK